MTDELSEMCRWAADHIEGWKPPERQHPEYGESKGWLVFENHAELQHVHRDMTHTVVQTMPTEEWYQKFYWWDGDEKHSGCPSYPTDPAALARLRQKTLDAHDNVWVRIWQRFDQSPGKYGCEVKGRHNQMYEEVGATPEEAEFRAIVASWKAQVTP